MQKVWGNGFNLVANAGFQFFNGVKRMCKHLLQIPL
jgi:hypothetical protein